MRISSGTEQRVLGSDWRVCVELNPRRQGRILEAPAVRRQHGAWLAWAKESRRRLHPEPLGASPFTVDPVRWQGRWHYCFFLCG